MKNSTRLCAILLLAVGCTQGGPESELDLGTDPKADGPPSADMRMVEKASWDIQANFRINGQDVQSSARSAVFMHRTTPATQIEIILTDVVDYCAARKAQNCPPDAKFRIEFGLNGDAPGAYSIAMGQASVFTGDVIKTCQGAGLGADSGTLTLTRVEARQGGMASLRFDFSGLTGSANGTINATFCDAD